MQDQPTAKTTSASPRQAGSPPDAVSTIYFEWAFRVAYLKCRGTEFQNLFCQIMGAVYGEHFSPSGTWGNEGDLKCDGYLHPERRVFALYAPKDFRKASTGKSKIRNDHAGALKHWHSHMDHGPDPNRWTGLLASISSVLVPLHT